MGVPTFFKWLSVRYPRVLKNAIEPDSQLLNGQFIPPDPSIALSPNPNGEFDNVYLDMNGIIHPCCHPEGCEPPETEADMFEAIFDYIDRLVMLLRPRRLFYMAIDGVAPRAKMNQQRMRRFKSAAEAAQNHELYEELRIEAAAAGRAVPAKKPHWDQNVITPGTPFFARLSQALRWYILQRQLSHPAWKELRVILSDANVPGEGEHKIVSFIRNQRHVKGYDPNTRHCLCGADADLIMLGLATHEAHFTIVREQVQEKDSASTKCMLCGNKGHAVANCHLASSANEVQQPKWTLEMQRKGWQPMAFLHLPTLREYLAEVFCFRDHLAAHGVVVPLPKWKVNVDNRTGAPLSPPPTLPTPEEEEASNQNRKRLLAEGKVFVPDLERCIDDFIIMCFFVGNDFLPHLPSLSIHKGSIDQMVLLYQQIRPLLPDYLCDAGKLNLIPTRIFARHLGDVEGEVFRAEARRMANLCRRDEEQQQEQQQQQQQQQQQKQQQQKQQQQTTIGPEDANYAALAELRRTLFPGENAERNRAMDDESGTALVFEESIGSSPDESETILSHAEQIDLFKKKMRDRQKQLNECNAVKDEIGLGHGDARDWRRRYYTVKFDKGIAEGAETDKLAAEVARRYAEGMQWVALYYFQGVPSWGWYYPFHYAPLASDVARFGLTHPFTFELGVPFQPFQQLMAVLPPQSAHCLPLKLQDLMKDPHSPIRDFYPDKFTQDPDGKKFSWQWVVKLPFIDHARLVAAVDAVLAAPVNADLTEDDRDRNGTSKDQLFIPSKLHVHAGLRSLTAAVYCQTEVSEQIQLKANYEKIGGTLHVMKKCRKPLNYPVPGSRFEAGVGGGDEGRFPTIATTASTVVGYSIQLVGRNGKPKPHKCALLRGAKPVTGNLNPGDWSTDCRRFNAGAAQRMILGSLGRQGILHRDEVDRQCNQLRVGGGGGRDDGFHQQFQQQLPVNRYEQETFGQTRRPHNGPFAQRKRPRQD